MKNLFNVEGVSLGVKIQFGFALLLVALSPIFSCWLYTLLDSNIEHVWYVLFFQVLLIWVITKVYKRPMILSYDSSKHLMLFFCISPFISFALRSGDVANYEIVSGYVVLNIVYLFILMFTDVSYWDKARAKYNSSK